MSLHLRARESAQRVRDEIDRTATHCWGMYPFFHLVACILRLFQVLFKTMLQVVKAVRQGRFSQSGAAIMSTNTRDRKGAKHLELDTELCKQWNLVNYTGSFCSNSYTLHRRDATLFGPGVAFGDILRRL